MGDIESESMYNTTIFCVVNLDIEDYGQAQSQKSAVHRSVSEWDRYSIIHAQVFEAIKWHN